MRSNVRKEKLGDNEEEGVKREIFLVHIPNDFLFRVYQTRIGKNKRV